MPKKYSKARGWFPFYARTGEKAKIKIEPSNTETDCERNIVIKFKGIDSIQWSFYVPNRTFNSDVEITHYIMKNLEKNETIFHVKNLASSIISNAEPAHEH